MRRSLWTMLLVAASALTVFAAKDTCVDCHSALDGDMKAPATGFQDDIHRRHGFSCADCHGGDRTADDPPASMNRARGFVGRPARTEVPKIELLVGQNASMTLTMRISAVEENLTVRGETPLVGPAHAVIDSAYAIPLCLTGGVHPVSSTPSAQRGRTIALPRSPQSQRPHRSR